MRKVVILLVLALALWNCHSPTSSKPTATVHLSGVYGTVQTWDTGWRYEIDAEIIETGGVPITVSTVAVSFLDSSGAQFATGTFEPGEFFGSNRVDAHGNRYGFDWIYDYTEGHPAATSIKVSVPWTDDNGHSGTALGSGSVR